MTIERLDRGHGSPYDRGEADSYYRREYRPHYFAGETGKSPEVTEERMTIPELGEYDAGYHANQEKRNWKE